MSDTQYLDLPGGRLAYDVEGDGPLVVCVPGMGDLRSVYRFLTPQLVAAGYRVATMDLRGHGDSDATFDSYDDLAAGSDVLALVDHLGGGPAVLVGNSMGAAASVWAAAEQPAAVSALVLIGPFVREVPSSRATTIALRLAFRRPWGPSLVTAYYRRSYPERPPADFADHLAAIRASLAKPGHWPALLKTLRTSHAPVEARLDEGHVPALVVMGARDADFRDPVAEATLVAERLSGQVVIVPGAGHYPQAEVPEVVGAAVIDFLRDTAGAVSGG